MAGPIEGEQRHQENVGLDLDGVRSGLADAPDTGVERLAFDRTGHRLGYGGGFYDLTIARLRERKGIIAIGLAYAVQEIVALPTTPRDAVIDLVLTERDVIDWRGG